MGVNLKDKFLVGDYSKKLLKVFSFLGLFLLFIANGYGQPPSGYSVTIVEDPINTGNETAVSFAFSGAELFATYNYTFTSSGGGGSVMGSGTVFNTVQIISGINLSTLPDGTITLSVTLTNVNGIGAAATDTSTKDTAVPSGYSVTINQDPINAGNETAVSYAFAGAEVGATYNYTFTSSGGGGSVTGSGTVASAGQTISGINLSTLPDGTITLSVTLTDINGNPGAAATDTSTKDTAVPSGYSVTINQDPINVGDQTAVSFTFSGAEVGATYNYTFTSSGGGGSVTGSGTIAGAGQTISGINLSTLPDGTITLSVTLTDINGNPGAAATDTSTKYTAVPSGYSVTINQDPINVGNQTAVSFTFSGAEVGATYNYTFTSSGGGGSVTDSGTITGAGQTISGINLSTLPDGTITLSVTLTNVNGIGAAATDTSTKDTAVPSGYSVTINQDPINAGNETAVSYAFAGAEVGATYNYTFTSSGGGGSVTGSGTVASAGQTISGINLSTLPDGTITLSVTLTDINGNPGAAAIDTSTKDTAVPSGYSVTINQDPINVGNQTAVSFTFSGAEVGTTFNYSFTSNGGGGSVTGSGTVASAGQTVSGINLSGLGDGTITLSVTLTNGNGTGAAATDTATKSVAVPSGYSVTINQDPINASNENAVSFTFSGAEVGATYNYSFTSNGGGGSVTGSGTVANAGQTISGINLSTLQNGTITLSVTLTNVNGTGATVTDTATKDSCFAGTTAPVLNAGVPTELCDSSGQDLDAYTNTPAPPNSVLTWSTNSNPLNTGAHLGNSFITVSDTYYGFFYDASNDCASPVLQVVILFNTTPSTGSASPILNTAACNVKNGSLPEKIKLDDLLDGTEDAGDWIQTAGPETVDPEGRDSEVDFNKEPDGTYIYTYTTNTAVPPCTDQTFTVNITVSDCSRACDVAPPQILPGVPTAFCDEIPATHSLDDYTDGSAPTGTILVWSRNEFPTTISDHLSQAEIDNPNPGSYYTFFYDADNECWSPSNTVLLVLNSTPVITATTSDTLCGSGQAVLTAEGDIPNSANDPNFNWYATETSTLVLSNLDTYTTPILTETTTFWVEATLNGCTSAREEVSVTVNIEPSPGTPINSSACSVADNGTTTIDLDDLLTGADAGSWAITTDPSGGNVSIDGQNSVDFTGLADGNYEFTYTTTGALAPCTNQSVVVTVFVDDCSTTTDIDLEITKSVNTQIVQIGQEVIFTVTVNNLSDSAVSNVLISDALQSGFEFVSQTSSLGVYDNLLGEWTIGELLPLESATLDITAIVLDQGIYSNTATLISSLPEDSNDTNNEDTVTLSIGAPEEVNLLIEKTVESGNPLVGEEVVFTILVTNQSLEGTVSQIVVEDIIPDTPDTEFEYISHIADLGDYTRATGLWEIPSLALNQLATLRITVRVPRSGIWGNTATILSPPLVPGANPEAFARVNVNEPTSTEPGFLFNQFSPNGDGTNDLLKINNLENYPNNSLQIFNRYGNKVFEAQGMTDGNTWDGTRNGEQLSAGTYYYVLDLGDGSEIRKGWIQLIR